MVLRFETRGSDSPWVDTVWTCGSEQVTEMTSVAAVCWGLVFFQREGRAYAYVSGPETRAGIAPVPEGATFVGIEFAVGTSLGAVPTSALVDGGVVLPDATRRTFRLDGVRWPTSGPDDAEALVDRLVRSGTVVCDPLVAGSAEAIVQRSRNAPSNAGSGRRPGSRGAPYNRSNAHVRPRRCWPLAQRSPMWSPGSPISTSCTWPAGCDATSGVRRDSFAGALAVRSAWTWIR